MSPNRCSIYFKFYRCFPYRQMPFLNKCFCYFHLTFCCCFRFRPLFARSIFFSSSSKRTVRKTVDFFTNAKIIIKEYSNFLILTQSITPPSHHQDCTTLLLCLGIHFKQRSYGSRKKTQSSVILARITEDISNELHVTYSEILKSFDKLSEFE